MSGTVLLIYIALKIINSKNELTQNKTIFYLLGHGDNDFFGDTIKSIVFG